jgi:hypothetical protein
MFKPNFSESQLQQAVNIAFIRHVFYRHGHILFPVVPSLLDEFSFGWDTAFYIPWLDSPPDNKNEGCNFFVQYKLSELLTSAKAKQWAFWKKEYFRFKIPHTRRNADKKFVDDYHQLYCLRKLANKQYPTFYATNSILSIEDLKQKYNNNTLLNVIPVLDIRAVNGIHKYVTFTSDSNHFLLHSENEEIKKISFSNAINNIREFQHENMDKANERLIEVLSELQQTDESWQFDLLNLKQATKQIRYPWLVQYFISAFVFKHIGANMFWLPKRTKSTGK